MAIKFTKLTRENMRKLPEGNKLNEHGIEFERLQNGDGRFSVNVMVDGKRIHRIVGNESDGTTRLQAEEFIHKVRSDAKQGRLNLPKGRKLVLSFEIAAEKYLAKLAAEGGRNLKRKKQQIDSHLKAFFTGKPLNQINTSEIEQYKKMRLDAKVEASTINRELATISHLFTQAVEWKWIDAKPATIKHLKENPGRINYLTAEQAARLIEVAKQDQCQQVYPFIVIGLGTGMRRMEILSIKIENIDLNHRIIFIPRAKAGLREQPITSSLAEFFAGYIKDAQPNQTWLFPSEKSRTGHKMNIEKPYRRVVQAAGLDPKQIVRHTLRHTAITHLVQSGVDLPTVKRISGHRTLQMVERYSHQNGAHIQAAMDKLEESYRRQ